MSRNRNKVINLKVFFLVCLRL